MSLPSRAHRWMSIEKHSWVSRFLLFPITFLQNPFEIVASTEGANGSTFAVFHSLNVSERIAPVIFELAILGCAGEEETGRGTTWKSVAYIGYAFCNSL